MKKSRKWLEILAAKVEEKYGPKTRDRIFGDIPKLPLDPDKDAEWLHCFIRGINSLNDVDFTHVVMKNTRPAIKRRSGPS